MGSDLGDAGRRQTSAQRRHRVRRFCFRREINLDAQHILATLARQLALQLDGVESCELAFDRASGQWVEYTIRTDNCPAGEEISPNAALALLARLRAIERGEDFLTPCRPHV